MVSLAVTVWGRVGARPEHHRRDGSEPSKAQQVTLTEPCFGESAAELHSAWTGRRPAPTWSVLALFPHGQLYARFLREGFRLVVACIHVPDYAHAWVGGQYTFDSLGHHFGAVGYSDLSGV
jgi:hypothetical protein